MTVPSYWWRNPAWRWVTRARLADRFTGALDPASPGSRPSRSRTTGRGLPWP